MKQETMSGAEIVLRALRDQHVDTLFGYPGGAVLPIYDALFQRNDLRHILVRHEQGAVHAAEGYARSTGRVGVVLVTSGPGATNSVTGLTDALMDSIPLVCLTGQVATHLIGNDAFQEADTVGITRSCTKHNYLVKDINHLARIIHEAFYIAHNGRPGPVLVDIPKDIQFAKGPYIAPEHVIHKSYKPQVMPKREEVQQAIDILAKARKPIFYTGGGVINSGLRAAELLTQFIRMTGIPCTNTLMGLGGLPGSDPHFLGMLGMHGTYEANLAMYHCDVMVAVGARFDDRVTGKLSEFSPHSQKIHIDIDRSSINKNVLVDLALIGDCGYVLEAFVQLWTQQNRHIDPEALHQWWNQIQEWKNKDCLRYQYSKSVIKPQYALQVLTKAIQGYDYYITTEVGQHQMWAAQFIPFERPYHWLTSGGLGTMGYGLPAAIGCQLAHPEALVIDVAGEASILMKIQELGTAVQYRAPVKVFILNNKYMGMVRQWQELLHGGRYAESYSDALPDFVKLAEAFGAVGLRIDKPSELEEGICTMIETPRPVVVDVVVDPQENCFPMIPGGKAHYEMMLYAEPEAQSDEGRIADEGRILV